MKRNFHKANCLRRFRKQQQLLSDVLPEKNPYNNRQRELSKAVTTFNVILNLT